MDEEFKLCWKNFQDNIASGFQNLFDRGDLVDVTLACDGRLLQAHKFVLAICSPYFQEIFIKNPCRHPTIVLKDVSYNIMCELLEFMYQGVVNVKHTELQTFMKIGQELQIKGLATNSSASSASSQNSPNHNNNAQTDQTNPDDENTADKAEKSKDMKSSTTSEKEDTIKTETNKRTQSPAQSMPSPVNTKSSNDNNTDQEQQQQQQQQQQSNSKASSGSKRHLSTPDYNSETLSVLNRSKIRRSMASVEDMNENMTGNSMSAGGGGNNSMDHMTPDDFFFPHISMTESRYDIMKRDVDNSSDSHHSQQHTHPHHHHHHHHQGPSHHSNQPSAAAVAAAASLRSSFPPGTFGLDYAFYKNNSASSSSQQEYPNELHGDFSRNIGNHMDIPPIAPGEHWFQGKLEFMLSQRGKPLLVHDGHTFGIQYVRKDKKYWQCNLSRKFNCKARVTTTDTGEIIVTNNEHCHTEIRQHLRKDYQRNKVMMNALINLSTNRLAVENLRRHNVNLANNFSNLVAAAASTPLAMQQHMDMDGTGGAMGSILDLGKRTASFGSNDNNELKSPSATAHNHINHHQQQQHSHNMSIEDLHQQRSDEHNQNNDEPLDCGVRSMVTTAANTLTTTASDSNLLNRNYESIAAAGSAEFKDEINKAIEQPQTANQQHSNNNVNCKTETL